MISVQVPCTLDEALVLLNARARADEQSVQHVARAVVAGEIRFGRSDTHGDVEIGAQLWFVESQIRTLDVGLAAIDVRLQSLARREKREDDRMLALDEAFLSLTEWPRA
jgi:hypothetical protein